MDGFEPSRWQQLEQLWETTFGLPEAERQRFLDNAAASDAELRAEIEALCVSAALAEAFFRQFASIIEAGVDEAMDGSHLEDVRAGLTGRYVLEREVGQGGMATVYLAHDVRHHRDVALKVLKPAVAATLGVERFLREIEIAAGMRHPHILPVFDSGEAGTFLYYVMPYEPGLSLRERLQREGALPLDDAVRILRDVVDALAHAHEHGIVHLDIKPENVLLSERHATVADFGLARAIAVATGGPGSTTGIAAGTPRHMAPEQASGESKIDHRADIYAVGVLAYEMLAGRPLFIGETTQAILAAHMKQEPPPLSALRPAVPPELGGWVMKCLAKRPADRWQRTDEMLARLETLRRNVPEAQSAHTVSGPVTTVRTRLKRWPVLAGVLAAAAILVWGFGQFTGARRAASPLVAVLPFVNRGDADDAPLADGMTVELISKLAGLGLRPLTSTSVFEFSDRHEELREIADSLNVPYIVEGDWQRIGSDLRVRVALVDARDRSTLWSTTYPRAFGDVFLVQDEIARTIAGELGPRLGVDTALSIRGVGTANPAAYELYLLGQDRRAFRTDSAARQALEYFRQAVALDSLFAGAWAKLAEMLIRVAPREDLDMPVSARIDLADGFAAKAVALDDSLAEAHTVLGLVRIRQYRLAEAEQHLKRTIDLEPGASASYLVYVYIWRGQFKAALHAARRSLDANPLSPGAHVELARAYLVNGRCDLAREQLARIANLDPPVGRAQLVAAQCYALEQKWADALQLFPERRPERPARPLFGYLLVRAGQKDEAAAILAEFRNTWERTGNGAFDVATVYVGLNDFDQAFIWLDRSIDDRSLRWEIMEPMFADLRADPRFEALMKRVGLQNR